MGGANDGEIPAVKCQDTGDIQAFRKSDNRGINKIQSAVGIFIQDFCKSFQIGGCHRFKGDITDNYSLQKLSHSLMA